MYPKHVWFSDEIRPFHTQIRATKEKHNSNAPAPARDSKTQQGRNAAKRKLQALEKQNEDLKRNLSALKSNSGSGDGQANAQDLESNNKNDNAGNAFGGKRSMQKEKK